MPQKYVLKNSPLTYGDGVKEFILKRVIDAILEFDVVNYGFSSEQTTRILTILGIETQETKETE